MLGFGSWQCYGTTSFCPLGSSIVARASSNATLRSSQVTNKLSSNAQCQLERRNVVAARNQTRDCSANFARNTHWLSPERRAASATVRLRRVQPKSRGQLSVTTTTAKLSNARACAAASRPNPTQSTRPTVAPPVCRRCSSDGMRLVVWVNVAIKLPYARLSGDNNESHRVGKLLSQMQIQPLNRWRRTRTCSSHSRPHNSNLT